MCRCAVVIARAVVAFLDAVLVGCLRSRLRRASGSGRSEQGAPVRRRDRDAELTWDEERDLGRNGRYNEEFTGGSMAREELRLEANYLKLCGAISETPAELLIECDNMTTNAPAINCASLLEANSSEGYEEEHHSASELNIEDTQRLPGVELVPHPAFLKKSPFQSIQHKLVDYSGSPFPTPLVLRDDMQTPGTIYASHRGASLSGKRVQTRKQFVYPILRPIENRLEQMELKEDSLPLLSFNPPKRTNLEADSVKKPKQTHSNSERPVLNASDLETPSLPKAWDGNGIPNTTTRYKKDQRVSWHTTPFEERLLKVLSDEEGRLPRKVVRGKLFHPEEEVV